MPGNCKGATDFVQRFFNLPPLAVDCLFFGCCNFKYMTELENILKKHQSEFAPVIPFNREKDKFLRLDFSAANPVITPELFNDTSSFSAYINGRLAAANARYGIGGYAENRTVYSRSPLFNAQKEGEEPRRLHLGIDIWAKPYTPVAAPLPGIVHSFAFNNDYGDYGATIVLSHQLDGVSFYTLYGHLSLNSIKNLQEGERMDAGDIIGDIGIPVENGHWPSHLHFQIIKDIQGWRGNFPGVCKYSEKDIHLQNCPNPDIILQLQDYVRPN